MIVTGRDGYRLRVPRPDERRTVTDLDDYFDYAMDLDERQRAVLLQRLRDEEPALAEQLERALREQVRNPDFLCQQAPPTPSPDAGPTVERLQHVTLRVGDLDRAVGWYTSTFRGELVRRDDGRAVLRFDGFTLHLVAGEGRPPGLTLVRPDVAAMGPSTRRPDGVRALHLVDPWGNAIEVVDRDGDGDRP